MLTLEPIILNEYWCTFPFSFGKVNLAHACETKLHSFLHSMKKKKLINGSIRL